MFKKIGLYVFVLFFILAGVFHFTAMEGFRAMLPEWVPARTFLVYATGVAEWVLAVLLLLPTTREQAGKWTAIYLVVIFPANIYAAVVGVPAPGSEDVNRTLLWVRILFQPVLIGWVLAVSKEKKSR
ncbi:hypothetical protein N781_06905 [Pontibacillus halophilus JSM 076056 = DSM 19796]|uniref:DoxX family protein n=1 Tax=Pontibacillus halophilus JSM 076056 = DSM 19796 TaxID=1385510 RepID=A0A0A5GH48_9BACI|nr:DoxX family protein [Pontibacillus halophilus]KGX90518.1 hypothetical protein N781_06905 [Pontibacillus halophilus JSM 076056 = DSM 19796]